MRKIAGVIIPIVILAFLGYMIHRIIVIKQKADAQNETKQKLPAFSFYSLNASKTGSSVIKPGVPIVIFYFNTDCDHCQYEAMELNANISAFKNVQVLMVSFNTAAQIKQFSKTYGLDKQSGVTFLVDKDYSTAS
jgi:peroxiredoxin